MRLHNMYGTRVASLLDCKSFGTRLHNPTDYSSHIENRNYQDDVVNIDCATNVLGLVYVVN